MQTKVYFANSVPAAIEAAREELGPDALLVNSRPAPSEALGFGRLEVTFAWDPPVAALKPAKAPPSPAQPASPMDEMDEIRQELAALRAAMAWEKRGAESRIAAPQRFEAPAQRLEASAQRFEDSPAVKRLCEAGLERDSARAIATSADPEDLPAILAAKIPVEPFVEMQPGEARTIAFVGPPGRGKTTSLVKAAVTLGLARGVPVRIYTAGAHPVGAPEQMARYAAILGVPHQAVESVESLGLTLNGDTGWKGLSLIDTPGISPYDYNEVRDFTRFFAARPQVETHLVLRAEGRAADHLAGIARFSGFGISRLLFTGTDETAGAGAMVDTLIRAGIPATFIGTGPQIPEGFEEIDAGKLARGLWSGSPARERYALAAA
jgi:flagellar biosynthesis protein FlhF